MYAVPEIVAGQFPAHHRIDEAERAAISGGYRRPITPYVGDGQTRLHDELCSLRLRSKQWALTTSFPP
jgi:hypothetical protein